MKRTICLHGHFYQPPRENPWLESVELQDSAYPYHDWNERVSAECYGPNSAARILNPDDSIVGIMNNYSRISFNFGPSVLSWMEQAQPEIYAAILEADKISQRLYGGHGSALAQVYNHLIMPLANSRDKRTQILWGIRDFEHRFGRSPEGMWLAETAVDLETLDLLAEQGIRFTILAPRQAARVRLLPKFPWPDASQFELLPPAEPSTPQRGAKKKGADRGKEEAGENRERESESKERAGEDREVAAEDREEWPEVTHEPLGHDGWHDVSHEQIDPKRPYLCRLPSGRSIALFFYDGPISRKLAFENLLRNGEEFAHTLLGAFTESEEDQLVHIATDGETYGHHHRRGEMALSYCLHYIETNQLARISIYGQYLEEHPPTWEVQIHEDSSWSCVHGVKRWYTDCGCNSGMHPGWHQRWRQPLRHALDWLRDQLISFYEEQAPALLSDPWRARDRYIHVILDRSPEQVRRFFEEEATRQLSDEEISFALRLLEIQRQAMLMFTSCGWFFDELSGIETTQVLQYASRALQLASETGGPDLEEEFVQRLRQAPSNIERHPHGEDIYNKFIRPARVGSERVGAHFAITSLFQEALPPARLNAYQVTLKQVERHQAGKVRLTLGQVRVRSRLVWQEDRLAFAVLHLGDHNINGGIEMYRDDGSFQELTHQLRDAFQHGDIPESIRRLDHYFPQHYSLWHLFRDQQRKIMKAIYTEAEDQIEAFYRQIYQEYYHMFQAMIEISSPLTPIFQSTLEFVISRDLLRCLEAEPLDQQLLDHILQEIEKWSIQLDNELLGLQGSEQIDGLVEQLATNPLDYKLLDEIARRVKIFSQLEIPLNLWHSQNMIYKIGQQQFFLRSKMAERGEETASRWVKYFKEVATLLEVRFES